ncbi:MAG TPA: AI-2E family transporter [Kofleriaceae bacterium]|nr:AI-2E family transporter [Kofleriaceae bacterium]
MLRWLLIMAFLVLAWFVVSYLASVLAPILAALGIAYLLHPVLDRLVARGLSRGVGAGILLITFIAIVVGAVAFLVPRVADQVSQFIHDAPQMMQNINASARQHLGIELPTDWVAFVTKEASSAGSSGPLRELATAAVGGVFHVLGVLAELLLVPVFSFYFMVDWPNIIRRFDHVVPPRRRREVREIVHEIDTVVAGWVRGQAIVTSLLAVLYAIGFTIAGMPLSLPIGLLVGLLTVIPFVGTFVGASIALLVTIADGGSLGTVGAVAAVILVLHLTEAAILTPKIVGHRVGLSETGALFAVVAGGKLLGFVGVVLAVPIAATTAVLVRYAIRYYEHTAFFGRESDADVVITPAMALIMPGVPGAEIIEDLIPGAPPQAELDLALGRDGGLDDWEIEPELGAAGKPPPPPTQEPAGGSPGDEPG